MSFPRGHLPLLSRNPETPLLVLYLRIPWTGDGAAKPYFNSTIFFVTATSPVVRRLRYG
jgi:hypothetical protein